MNVRSLVVAVVFGAALACNAEKKQECDQFLGALKPLDSPPPSADAALQMRSAIAALQLQDKPLQEYGASAKATLEVLANALETQAGATPPDGTDDLVKARLKEALGEKDDVARYCAQ